MKRVMASGCFDPFHPGHLYHLRAARRMGDELVVALTKDKYVNKGPGRPVFPAHERAEVLSELRCVAEVILVDSSLDGLIRLRPAVFVKGAEYRGKILPEDRQFCLTHGVKIRFTDEQTYSSTALLSHESRRR